MSEEQIDELIEYNLEYFNKTLEDEQIANSMLDKVELETKLQEKNKEIERLNNIINTFEEWLEIEERKCKNYATNDYEGGYVDAINTIIEKLKELKGENNE